MSRIPAKGGPAGGGSAAAAGAAGQANATGPNGENVQTKQPMSELDTIHLRMNQITDESLDSTRRMMQLCEDAKESGIKTLVLLDDQGEQLDRVEEGMDKINTDMKEAEKNIEGLEKCCGLCVLPWKKGKNVEKSAEYSQTWKKQQDGAALGDGPRIHVDNGLAAAGGYVTRITNDAREDEMDNNLQEVGNMVSNLRNIAIDMGNEVTQQNQKLDRINNKATMNKDRISQANTRADKLLK